MDGQTLYISSVYASTNLFNEDGAFIKTNLQLDFPGPWCFIGDSYDVLGAHEVRGSTLPLKVAGSPTLIMTRGAEYTCVMLKQKWLKLIKDLIEAFDIFH